MTQHRPVPEDIPPGRLLLRTKGACELDPEHLVEVFGRQRQRFAAVLRGFGPADWAAPTRCAEWSAHDVVRHLCDGSTRVAAADPQDRTLDLSTGFDPRITPRRWPVISASESPGATLTRFLASTDDLLTVARDRVARRHSFDVHLPYGPMDWTVFMLHGFWDSWLHERDVLLPRGREHPTDGDATGYATAYGLFIAAVVAAKFGGPVQQTLPLSGAGGGVFELGGHDGVTLTVTRLATAGPPAAEAADALAGRTSVAVVLGNLPARTRTALSRMADFFNAPVPDQPAGPRAAATGQ